jgi:hypothetical protein
VAEGLPDADFEERYYKTLEVSTRARRLDEVLLIDDVCTEGSTLFGISTCAQRPEQDLRGEAARTDSRSGVENHCFFGASIIGEASLSGLKLVYSPRIRAV